MMVHKILCLLLICSSSSFVLSHKRELPKDSNVCQTKECREMADTLHKAMNKSMDPCENFYEFTCGKWKESYSLPSYLPIWSRMLMFQLTVYDRLNVILQAEPKIEDILPVRQAKKFFKSCMDEETLERRGLIPLESILMRIGGWPMIMDPQEWDSDEYSWQTVEHYYFHVTGSYVLYQFKPYEKIMGIEPGDLPLSNKLPLDYKNYTGEDYTAYMTLIAGVAQIFLEHNKADVSDAMLAKDVRDLVDFENKLYMMSSKIKFRRHSMFWRSTLNNLTNWYNTAMSEQENKTYTDTINFTKLVQTMMDLINEEANVSLQLHVKNREYFINLTNLLNETPKRTIVNYLHWHFVSDMILYTTNKMREIFFSLMEKEFGITERPPRLLECIKQTEMTDAAAYAFMKNYYTEKSEKIMSDLTDNIRKGMGTLIHESNWISDDDKKITQQKLRDMKFSVGFPDWFKNDTAVLNSFRGLTVGYDFMDNVLSYRKYTLRSKLRHLNDDIHGIPALKIPIDSITVNALYRPNEIYVPAVDFQPPLFTQQFPEYVNYGMTGVVIAHEVGHAYDSTEFLYSKNKIKLSQDAVMQFFTRVKCFLGYFEELFNETNHRLEVRTLGENIADATGLQAALISYRNLLKQKNGIDTKLPGFEEFTNDQMFFISFGSIWCETVTPQYAEKRKQVDTHSPGRVRVLGSVSNNEEFSKAFNCPAGSSMNREHKCNLWKSADTKPSI